MDKFANKDLREGFENYGELYFSYIIPLALVGQDVEKWIGDVQIVQQ